MGRIENQWANPILTQSEISPMLIVLFNLFTIGGGYFALGQWRKGIKTITLSFLWSILGIILVPLFGLGFILIFFGLFFYIATVADAYMLASRYKQGIPIMIGECASFGGLLTKFLRGKDIIAFATDSETAPEEYKTRMATVLPRSPVPEV